MPSNMCLESSVKSWADWMAIFWVQQFFTLPVIFQNSGMGDEPPQRHQPFEAVDQLGKFNFQVHMASCRLEQGPLFNAISRGNGCACCLLVQSLADLPTDNWQTQDGTNNLHRKTPIQTNSKKWKSITILRNYLAEATLREDRPSIWDIWQTCSLTIDRQTTAFIQVSLCHQRLLRQHCTSTHKILNLLDRRGHSMILPSSSNTQMPSYRISRIE
jgi:hypothetical protein